MGTVLSGKDKALLTQETMGSHSSTADRCLLVRGIYAYTEGVKGPKEQGCTIIHEIKEYVKLN